MVVLKQCKQYLKLLFSVYNWIVCHEKLCKLLGKCSNVDTYT